MGTAQNLSGEQKTIKSVLGNIRTSLRLAKEAQPRFLLPYFILIVATNALPFAVVWYSALFINKITTGSFSGITDPALLGIVIMYVLLPIIQDILVVWRQEQRNIFFLKFQDWFKTKVISKKSTLDIQVYESSEYGDLMTKVDENLHRVANMIDYTFDLFAHSIQLILATSVIVVYKWWFAIVLFIALIPDAYVQARYGKRTWGIWNAKASIKRRYLHIYRHFLDVPSLIEIKVGQTSRYLLRELVSQSAQFIDEQIKNINQKIKLKLGAVLILALVLSGIFIYAIREVVVGVLAVGTFIFIISSISRLQASLGNFMKGLSNIYGDNLFVIDIYKFLNTPNILKNGTILLTTGTPGIEFEQVSFTYPQSSSVSAEQTKEITEKKVFNNITFTIKPGEKIAMVGVNGAGKTTLTKLLMRFYDPTAGNIFIGGHNLRDIDIDTYYKKIGYLSQEYDRFKFSVQEAIGMGNTTYPFTKDKVIDAAKRAQAHEFIMEWPHGYDTQLGKEFDGGVEPSIGQWQKLALARLFYRNPDIWILDEPTASIDAVAEMEIFHELEQLPKDKTVILISHRFNTVKNADRIMVIEHGEIKEFASHEELMQIPHGIYRTLFTKQKDSFSDN